MRIAILGTGAVGGWFGGNLAKAGHDVVFIARGETLEVLRVAGLTLNSDPAFPVTAVASLAEAAKLGTIDVVLLCVKITDATDLNLLLAGLPSEVPVAVTQNSVEIPQLVAEIIGQEQTWPGVVRGYFHQVGPAEVAFHGGPISYTFGAWPSPGATVPALREFATALEDAGVDATVLDDIFVDVWLKAMYVTSTGALGVLTQATLGELRTTFRDSLEAMMAEIYETSLAHGVDLPLTAVADTLAFADQMPAEATSSMHRDILAGQPNELNAQVGAICRMGQRGLVDVRLHDLLFKVLG